LGGSFTGPAGTVTVGQAILRGYNAARGDVCTGTNRPLIVGGSNTMSMSGYSRFENLRFTSTAAAGLSLATTSSIFNCLVTNTGGAGSIAISGSSGHSLNCEAVSANGIGFNGGYFYGCYAHDSTTGFCSNGAIALVTECIASNCTTGILVNASSDRSIVIGNTVYNCTTGIDTTTALRLGIFGNIITNCTTGFTRPTVNAGVVSDFNCWYTAPITNGIANGINDITSNPLLNSPGAGDFTIQALSPCLGASYANSTKTGVVGSYSLNIGADQSDHVSAGASNFASW
jgi:parallel beta-helix repeat protein